MLTPIDEKWLRSILNHEVDPNKPNVEFVMSLHGFGFQQTQHLEWDPAEEWLDLIQLLKPDEQASARHRIASHLASLISHWIDGHVEPVEDYVVQSAFRLAEYVALPLVLEEVLLRARDNCDRVFPGSWLGLSHADALIWAIAANEGISDETR